MIATTTDDLRKQHKDLKRQVTEAEQLRNGDRGWKSKSELLALKKEKLRIKELISKSKS
jgi:hypothetical protein